MTLTDDLRRIDICTHNQAFQQEAIEIDTTTKMVGNVTQANGHGEAQKPDVLIVLSPELLVTKPQTLTS